MKKVSSIFLSLGLLFTFVGCGSDNKEAKEITISAAASLEDPMNEIIKKYDVDGIHFDDYFYPYDYPLPEGKF